MIKHCLYSFSLDYSKYVQLLAKSVKTKSDDDEFFEYAKKGTPNNPVSGSINTPLPKKEVIIHDRFDVCCDNQYLLDFGIKWCQKKFPSLDEEDIMYYLTKANGILPAAVNLILDNFYQKQCVELK